MKNVKVEFRCTEEEKKKLYDMAERKGLKAGAYILNSTDDCETREVKIGE